MLQKLKKYFTNQQIIFVIAIAISLYIGISTLGVISKNYTLQKRVDELEQEIEATKLQNQQLEYQVAYFKTDEYVERQARANLGLKKPGEQVVIFPDKVNNEYVAQKPKEPEKSIAETAQSNLAQWMFFLFNREPS